MCKAEDDTEIQAAFSIDEVQSLVYETGFRKPSAHVTVADKSMVASLLVNYHCMTKVKAVMDQYIDGLESLKLLNHIRADPLKWKDFFVDNGVTVDAGTCTCILKELYLFHLHYPLLQSMHKGSISQVHLFLYIQLT